MVGSLLLYVLCGGHVQVMHNLPFVSYAVTRPANGCDLALTLDTDGQFHEGLGRVVQDASWARLLAFNANEASPPFALRISIEASALDYSSLVDKIGVIGRAAERVKRHVIVHVVVHAP
jgi:hypothetical protein